MYQIINDDCLNALLGIAPNTIDTIITDPPYGLGFMGKDWDRGVPGRKFWQLALRVAKPGATLLAFGGTRTWHRLAVAIEDTGWEIRDTIAWVCGSGFPKSLNIGVAVDKTLNAERKVIGQRDTKKGNGGTGNDFLTENSRSKTVDVTAPATDEAAIWEGWGTGLKPAFEPIIVAQKPLDGTYAQNALKWGVSGLNVDGARVGSDVITTQGGNKFPNLYGTFATAEESQHIGRWPANLIHDGSDEVLNLFPNNSNRFFYCAKASKKERNAGLTGLPQKPNMRVNAPRENEAAKHSNKMANYHPTVKPIALMRYLARLTKTPTGGVVLDMFAGSGSTGIGAILEGRDVILIEKEAEYIPIIEARMAYWMNENEQNT